MKLLTFPDNSVIIYLGQEFHRANKNLEAAIIKFSLENPHLGQALASRQFNEMYEIEISPSGVRNMWLRENIQTSAQRIQRAQYLQAAI